MYDYLHGYLFGTKGVLAALAVSRIFIIVSSFLINCVRCHGFPKAWKDIMLLPTDFGGTESDNIYAEIWPLSMRCIMMTPRADMSGSASS